ncbi:imelysin family protein [Amnibacterium sp. CER49]|uniref:iron uptake system protein EfeO n=1 Tax=Amnibacterium sp. CER49 TaxID=3039161 RepID=UPI00244B9D15|nr:iron uptake system protein EfeO [Amnibacterium sp. CER49]MDH2445338.1 imelysin family protein [Amnibacterium sp. CER49]
MPFPRALRRVAASGAAAVLVPALLAGCSSGAPGSAAGAAGGVTVTASDTSCALSATSVRSGTTTFAVTNSGSTVTEFELLAADGVTILGELENIGPGLTQRLSVRTTAGRYTTLCRPGMTGPGVGRTAFTVRGGTTGESSAAATAAVSTYRAYVREQAAALLTATEGFAALVERGDTASAKAAYPKARAFYERIEPIAEKLGDLDPQLDARKADLADGAVWTGWHRLEQDLWTSTHLPASERKQQATLLVHRTQQLVERVSAPSFPLSVDGISNGAIGLLDEIAASKVTGEEEVYSHTDLADFAANVEGAQVAYRAVRGLAEGQDAALVRTLDRRFAALEDALARYGSAGAGFRSYDSLSKSDVKALSDGVNAVSEPLSELTAAVLEELG